MDFSQLGKMRLKILIFEPSEHLRAMLDVMVRPIRKEVYLADNIEAGLALARLARPDLIIADYSYDGSGAVFCHQVRQDLALGKTPIVMLSAFSHLSLTQYLTSGCNQLVCKPFRCMDLYSAISAALAGDARSAPHLVPVIYRSGETDLIDARLLEKLIKAGQIDCFRRRDGLVFIGRDPIRSEDAAAYGGEERRNCGV